MGIVSFALLIPAQFLAPGGTSSRKANVRGRSGSPTMPLCLGSRPEPGGGQRQQLLLTAIIFSAPLAAVAADRQSGRRLCCS